jgi:hypothetical protein
MAPVGSAALKCPKPPAPLEPRATPQQVSDQIGRRNTFNIFCFGSIPCYAALPTLTSAVISTGSTGTWAGPRRRATMRLEFSATYFPESIGIFHSSFLNVAVFSKRIVACVANAQARLC